MHTLMLRLKQFKNQNGYVFVNKKVKNNFFILKKISENNFRVN